MEHYIVFFYIYSNGSSGWVDMGGVGAVCRRRRCIKFVHLRLITYGNKTV